MSDLTAQELLAEGERLARPVVHLVKNGKERVASWGGAAVVAAPRPGLRHWISVDCAFLPTPCDGWMSVFTDEEGDRPPCVSIGPKPRRLPADGTPLFAREARSLPPLDALFQVGSPRVKRWLRAQGWTKQWGEPADFEGAAITGPYQEAFQASCPLYTPGPYAVLGGWHVAWPEEDGYAASRRLAMWTFEESEPWLEVVEKGEGYRVFERIT